MSTAVVVGGGIGGLAAAVGLRRAAWDVVVLERAPAFAPVGAGLSLMANGLVALDALGVGAAVRAAVRPYAAMTVRNRRGRVLARSVLPDAVPAAGVHRATLHGLLLGALGEDVVRLGAEVLAVAGGTRPEVTYRRGATTTTLGAGLVVGADGVRSAVRAALWPEVPAPAALGCTAWRGVTPEPADLPDAEVSWGPGTEVGLVPLEDGRTYWYVSVTDDRIPTPAPAADEHATALALVDGWYAQVRAAVGGTEPGAVVRTPLVHLARGPASYARGAVALLGDAAHAMPPYVGQGANQALEDAAVLASVAVPGDDVPARLAEYDRRRRPRATRVARASRQAGRAGHLVRSRALVAARDVVVGAAPAGALAGSMARVARWEGP